MSVIAPGNLSLDERDTVIRNVESKLFKFKDELKIIYAKSGFFETNTNLPQDTIGTIFLEYVHWTDRRKSAIILGEMRNELADIPGIIIEATENKPGPPPEKPIRLDVASRDFNRMTEAADKVITAMHKMNGLTQIEDSRARSAVEWHIVADRERAAKYGIDISSIGNTIRLISNGLKISSYRPDDVDEEVDVLLRFPEEYRSIHNLDRVNIITTEGGAVPISNFVTKSPEPKVNQIKKVNRDKVITIKADVEKGELADNKVQELKKWMAENDIYQMASIKFKGEDQDQKEASDFLLGAFFMTLVMMYILMLIQFNSYYHTLIVMSAVFLSTIGVLLGLLITGQPFGVVMCGVGIIALGGIVLNNNILFIDTYQRLRAEGVELREAIIRAGVQRLRPILLTATTAVLGLLPMVFGLTINLIDRDITLDAPSSQWWRQLAASIAGGLTFATILTLFFTPCLLLIGRRFEEK